MVHFRSLTDVGIDRALETEYQKQLMLGFPFLGEPKPPRFITKDTNGVVAVKSKTLDKARDYIGECLVKSYRYKLAKARGNNKEERVLNALDKEKARTTSTGGIFEKHLKKSY